MNSSDSLAEMAELAVFAGPARARPLETAGDLAVLAAEHGASKVSCSSELRFTCCV